MDLNRKRCLSSWQKVDSGESKKRFSEGKGKDGGEKKVLGLDKLFLCHEKVPFVTEGKGTFKVPSRKVQYKGTIGHER